jgi:hypothetical protein
MPLDKSCSIQAFKTNLKRLVEEGYENPQLFAIAMNTLKRACGVDPMARMSPEEVVSAKSEEAFGLAGPPKVFNPYRTGLASHLWPNLPEKGVFKSGWEQDGIAAKSKPPKSRFGRYITIESLFEDLPSSPAIRGMSFSIAPGVHGVGTSPSASPVLDGIGLLGTTVDGRMCPKCGKGKVSKDRRCPVCGALWEPMRVS